MCATRSGRRRRWPGPALKRPINVAVCSDPTGEGVHTSVAESLKRAAEILADAGYAVEEPKLPSVMEAHEVWDLICQGELKEFFADTVSELADAPMKQAMRYMMTRMREFTLKEYLDLYTRRAAIVREWSVLLEKYPVLLAPVSTRPQFVHGEDILSQEANDKSYRDQATLTAICAGRNSGSSGAYRRDRRSADGSAGDVAAVPGRCGDRCSGDHRGELPDADADRSAILSASFRRKKTKENADPSTAPTRPRGPRKRLRSG